MRKESTLGLVLGRFQPFHLGHLHLISLAFEENDKVVICIGSAQKAEPLTIGERHTKMQKQLDILDFAKSRFRIVDLIDPNPMDIWPAYVKEMCGVKDNTINTFYRGEELPEKYKKDLKNLGFKLRIIKRVPFYVQDKEGLYHLVSSSTEIKKLISEIN